MTVSAAGVTRNPSPSVTRDSRIGRVWPAFVRPKSRTVDSVETREPDRGHTRAESKATGQKIFSIWEKWDESEGRRLGAPPRFRLKEVKLLMRL